MKTIFKMMLPVAAFMLASAGAVSTTGAKSLKADGTVLINGWIQNPDADHCDPIEELDCKTTSGTPVCMTSGSASQQAFLKTPGGRCTVPLYRVIR